MNMLIQLKISLPESNYSPRDRRASIDSEHTQYTLTRVGLPQQNFDIVDSHVEAHICDSMQQFIN